MPFRAFETLNHSTVEAAWGLAGQLPGGRARGLARRCRKFTKARGEGGIKKKGQQKRQEARGGERRGRGRGRPRAIHRVSVAGTLLLFRQRPSHIYWPKGIRRRRGSYVLERGLSKPVSSDQSRAAAGAGLSRPPPGAREREARKEISPEMLRPRMCLGHPRAVDRIARSRSL